MIIIDISLILIVSAACLHWVPSRHWFFEVSLYFSQQFFYFLVALIILKLWLGQRSFCDNILTIIASICSLYHLLKFIPFTRLWPMAVQNETKKHPNHNISILVSNVYQDNRQFHKLITLIEEVNTDVIVLLETDQTWVDEVLKNIDRTNYPHSMVKSQKDTYGILLISKRKIIEADIRYITSVPSIQATISGKGDHDIQLFVVHPRPPAPGEATTSLPKNRELLGVANLIKDINQPTIVTGDLNEVAWSKTSKRFLKISGLRDPRLGRGILSTFPTYLPMFRFPLDHVFCSHHFRVIAFNRLPHIGSDHFPLFIQLAY